VSFELHIQCFRSGEPSGMDLNEIRRAFGSAATELEPTYWQLHYDDLNQCNASIDLLDESLVHGVSIHRPCAHIELYDSLYAILASDHCVLYYPGVSRPLAAHPEGSEHMPEDMRGTLGEARLVTSGAQIRDIIGETE
jgi:hypothetical protein